LTLRKKERREGRKKGRKDGRKETIINIGEI
jgi:hypothetical protein